MLGAKFTIIVSLFYIMTTIYKMNQNISIVCHQLLEKKFFCHRVFQIYLFLSDIEFKYKILLRCPNFHQNIPKNQNCRYILTQ